MFGLCEESEALEGEITKVRLLAEDEPRELADGGLQEALAVSEVNHEVDGLEKNRVLCVLVVLRRRARGVDGEDLQEDVGKALQALNVRRWDDAEEPEAPDLEPRVRHVVIRVILPVLTI